MEYHPQTWAWGQANNTIHLFLCISLYYNNVFIYLLKIFILFIYIYHKYDSYKYIISYVFVIFIII